MEKVPRMLPFLDSHDRERLQRSLQVGEISRQDFIKSVMGLALEGIQDRIKLHDPNSGFNLSDQTDIIGFIDGVKKMVNNIFDDWKNLQVIWIKHFGTLHKRWVKKNVIKRKAHLLEAWPNMNPTHHPDFDVIRRELKGPDHRDALMMPCINLEDLSSAKNLLSLITSRTRMCPEHFIWVDSKPFKTAATMNAVSPAAHPRKVMLLTDQKTRDTYGTLRDI
ncbi:MAG: hypothetical protein L6R41_005575 [Letrouitia leprolyta]|nr:MAG: hypothetical protein L6R41_005575 [Letrouitia leprolyta]